MTAPTFVNEVECADWQSLAFSKSTSAALSVQPNDYLIAFGMTADGATQITACSGGSLTWTRVLVSETNSQCQLYIYTAVPTSAASVTVAMTISNLAVAGGLTVQQWRNVSGLGTPASITGAGAPSLTLTTTADNSGIAVLSGDWNARSGTRTWRAINGITPTAANGFDRAYSDGASSTYTVYSAYYPDAGAAGAKVTGLTAPTGQQFATAAIEIKGASAPATPAFQGWGVPIL